MNSARAEGREPPRRDAAPPGTIAIVVGFNSARHLPACLASLEAQRGADLEIHVVDNASSDGSADLVRRDFPRVRLHANERNVGFAGGNNQILESSPAAFYVLANPDTIVHPGAVAACVDYLKRDPRAGVVATRLLFPDGSLQRSCYSFLGLRNLLGETLGVHRFFPGLRPLTSFYMPWFAHDRVAEVDWLPGAFLVVRGEVVRGVGAFDPDFFMYGEEMDWCRRIRRAGWTVVFLPEPPVVHVGGESSKPVAGPMFVENLKGRVRFLRKHRGPLVAAAGRGIIAFAIVARLAWREAEAAAGRISGRTPSEALRLKQEMFRAAFRWVLAGLPVATREVR
jgi:GT2 family glycosyltransferase